MTRQELRTALASALARQDLADALLDTWIQSATTRLNTTLRHRQMIQHKLLAVNSRTFRVPSDFIEARNIRVNSGNVGGGIDPGTARGELAYAPPSEIADMAASAARAFSGCSGLRYFTLHGLDMELAPWTTTGPLQIEMWYYGKLILAPDAAATNFVLTDYPHLYLNVALTFAHRFELEEERALGYEALFVAEVQAINDAEKMAEVGNGPLIMRPTRRIGGRFS